MMMTMIILIIVGCVGLMMISSGLMIRGIGTIHGSDHIMATTDHIMAMDGDAHGDMAIMAIMVGGMIHGMDTQDGMIRGIMDGIALIGEQQWFVDHITEEE